MKKAKNFIFVYVMVAFVVAGQETQPSLAGLSWLSGCWRANLEGTILEEHWSWPTAGTLVGFSRAVEQEETVFIEFSTIAATAEGVFYTAFLPASNKMISFKMTSADSCSLNFANPEHDFPQTIRYQRLADDKLLVQLRGVENGQEKEESYAMQKEDCP